MTRTPPLDPSSPLDALDALDAAPTVSTLVDRHAEAREGDIGQDGVDASPQVAVVGSPSSNYEVTLDILDAAAHQPLVGSMLYLTHPLGEGTELALGTVAQVTTENQWHTNNALRGVVKARGTIPGMSGDAGDVRAASIKIQACYRRGPGPDAGWVQGGPTMRMSPPTGAAIRTVTDGVFADLMAGETDLHYLGTLHGTTTAVPMRIEDFSGPAGATHAGVFGRSGSGKTAASAYLLAGQMRYPDHGVIIIDPQGQWSHEQGLPFSLQGFADEMGRTVSVRRISEDLRLAKDAPLFGLLLGKTRFLREIMKMAAETQELLVEELVKALRKITAWDEMTSEALLDDLLTRLREPNVLARVYADKTKQIRLMVALSEILGQDCEVDVDGDTLDADHPNLRAYRLDTEALEMRRADALTQFTPLHNLFSPTNPAGGARTSLWGAVSAVFDRAARAGGPAPLLILDMSTEGGVSWIDEVFADDEAAAMREALGILDDDAIKATILSQVCSTLKQASEAAFRDGETLNTMVVFDEAWRFAPPPMLAPIPEIKALSVELGGYARDTRKFGIGWTYITQTTRSLNPDVWDQLSIRVMGYGLSGADLDKVGETLDDRDHLKLYRGFAPPASTNPKVYPFMLTGPVSPLSFSSAPIFLAAYTDFQAFRDANHEWISRARLAAGLPVLTGTPTRPGVQAGPLSARHRPRATRAAGRPAAADVARLREHRATGGINPDAGTGLSTDPGFAGSLSALDDEPF